MARYLAAEGGPGGGTVNCVAPGMTGTALIGGVGVILIALAWSRLFPALRGIQRVTGETGERFPDDALTAE